MSEADFRIVRTEQPGAPPAYTLEVHDGYDALGCERWREFKTDSKYLRQMLGWMIRVAEQKERHADSG